MTATVLTDYSQLSLFAATLAFVCLATITTIQVKRHIMNCHFHIYKPSQCSLGPCRTRSSTDTSQITGHDVHQRCSAVCCCVRGREDGEGVKEQKQTADVIQAGGPSHPHSPIQMTYYLSLCLSRFSCRPRWDVLRVHIAVTSLMSGLLVLELNSDMFEYVTLRKDYAAFFSSFVRQRRNE